MATRYWVGGAGTWDATTTTNWSATSGGAAGASAPTSADNAIFNSASNATAYAVTVGTNAACLDVSIAGPAAGNVTITFAATSVINVYGSWLNAATGVAFTTAAGTVNFLGTSIGKTVTTNGISFANTFLNFNGIGGYWTLGSALTVSSGNSPNILAGTFDTGGFAMTLNNFLSTTTTNARTINLNNSAINCSGSTSLSLVATNLTFNAGTSTINCTGAAITFAGGSQTFYNVNFTSATAAINSVAITGANTFNDFNVTTTTLQKTITLSANQTVNGTLTLGATNTAPFRMSVVSDIVGTPRTLTAATLATLADVDFRDIVAAGTSSPWSGTRLGNCLGNSNITFAAAATKYWNLLAGGNWTSTAWALTSGGAVAVNNFPLAQDTVIIDDAGLTAGNTITMNTNADIGTLDMSTRSTAFTLALNNADPKFYGNVTLSSALTITGNVGGSPTFQFLGQGLANTLNTAGVTLTLQQFIVNCPNGSLTLTSNVIVELVAATSGTAILTAGTFNLNGFNLTAVAFSGSNSITRTLTQGSGTINMTGSGGTIWGTSSATGLTYTTRPVVNFTYAGSTGSRTITTNAASIIDANITAGTDNVILATAVGNLNFTGFAGSLANSTRTIYGNLTLASGMTLTSGALGTTFDRTGTQTITSSTQTFTNLLLYSEQFDNATAWAANAVTVSPNVTTAPDGTLTADKLVESATTSQHILLQINTRTNLLPYTYSVYAKVAEWTSFQLQIGSGGPIGTFDLVAQTASFGTGATAATIQSVGAGWFRCTVTGPANTSGFTYIYKNATSYLGDGVSGIYIWGAQLEVGATLTTYIPTTATTASITGNRIMDYPVTFSNSGTTNCLDALTLGSTRGLTMQGGTLNLKSGVTSTVGAFATTGTSPKYLGSTTVGTQATIYDASGTNTVSYITIKDSDATGGAVWDALSITNIDAGDNTGWLFSSGPRLVNEITMRLRSFAQPRRF